jgi:phage shock protein A
MMITLLITVSAIFVIGLITKNKIALKLKNLFNSKANKIIDANTDKFDLLNIKLDELSNKKNKIIKSLAKMKANELRNVENIKELETTINTYSDLAKKYKKEEQKEKCLNVLTQITIKQNELTTLTKTNIELQKYIVDGEKQLQLFKNHVMAIQSKIAIVENKKTNAEALSTLSGLDEKDENINRLLNNANIEYDTTKIASESILSENNIDSDIAEINLNEQYDKL